MQSRMHPRYYLSQEIFDREQEKIFRKLWLFVGLSALLPEHNSFITRKIAGIPVVVQNFNGVLKAFENVCLHRSAPLQQCFTGKRPLVCPYHAWSYDSNGGVNGIPDNDRYYRFSDEEQLCMNLREFSLKQLGGLLFINLDENPLPFEAQFGKEFIGSLESAASAFDGEILFTTWHARFNWKLVYENLRDFNHIRYLHGQSLATVANFPFQVVDKTDQSEQPLTDVSQEDLRQLLQTFSYGGPEGEIDAVRNQPWTNAVQRWGDVDAYFNWLPYPNLHIATGNGGYAFTIEHHVPVAPGRTDVEIFFVTAKKKRPYAASYQVLLSNMHYSKKILGEDIGMLEQVQAALHEDAPMPNQGAYEHVNRQVERWYATLMETDHGV